MMGELSFNELARTNAARAARWHPDFPYTPGWSGADWSNAMCGEAGEAANVVKKLRRAECGLQGMADAAVPALREALGDELADTCIYLDLLAQFYGIDLGEAVARKFNRVSEREGFPERLRSPEAG